MNDKLPALQFYTGDWRKDPCVQALDHEHKGVWIDLLCIMNETSQRGRLVLPNGAPMPDAAVARNLGIDQAKWKQIRSNLLALGVASEDDEGVLYNRRIVRDEAIRNARAEAGRKGGQRSKPKQTASKPPSKTEAEGGSSVAVAVSSSASATPPSPAESVPLAHSGEAEAKPSANGNGHPEGNSAPPPPVDELAGWLGPFAELVADNPLAARPRDRRSLLAEYGPDGLRPNVWRLETGAAVPAEERPRLFALALNGYAREGNRRLVTNEFSGMIRTLAVQEASLPRGSPANGLTQPSLTAAQYQRYSEIRRQLEAGGMDPDQAAAEADKRARSE